MTTRVRDTQHACARCHVRFAQPVRNRRGTVCEDCMEVEEEQR